MYKVCSSVCSEVFLGLALYFFLELYMVLGVHVVVCTTARFFKDNVLPPKWEKQAKPRAL